MGPTGPMGPATAENRNCVNSSLNRCATINLNFNFIAVNRKLVLITKWFCFSPYESVVG